MRQRSDTTQILQRSCDVIQVYLSRQQCWYLLNWFCYDGTVQGLHNMMQIIVVRWGSAESIIENNILEVPVFSLIVLCCQPYCFVVGSGGFFVYITVKWVLFSSIYFSCSRDSLCLIVWPRWNSVYQPSFVPWVEQQYVSRWLGTV